MHIILFFTYKVGVKDWLNSGLFEREVELYKRLVSLGYKVTFVTYDNLSYSIKLSEYGINHIAIFENIIIPKSNILYFIKTFSTLVNNRGVYKNADIFKTNQLLGSWIPIIAKLIYRKKLLVRTGYDLLEFSIRNQKNFFKLFIYFVLTQISIIASDLYTVSSSSDMKLIKSRFLFTKNKVKVRNNWVFIPKFSEINERYSKEILMVGRLEKQKNFTKVLNNLAESRFKINIYGDGSQEKKLLGIAKKLNLSMQIHNRLPNKDILNIYGKFIFYIQPSKFEGNPKALLEAMAAGCVVIASDIPNHREIIENEKNGLLIDFDKVNLLNFLNKISENQKQIHQLSNSARMFILENYTLEKYIKKEEKDYKSIL